MSTVACAVPSFGPTQPSDPGCGRSTTTSPTGSTRPSSNVGSARSKDLKVNLAAVNAKLAQLDGLAARHATAVQLGMPSFAEASGRTVTAPTTLPTSDDDR
jgi:hypothetical protein